MATSFADFADLDSSGEALGDGLTFDQVGYSDALTPLDDTLLGSSIELSPLDSENLSVFDGPTGTAGIALSGTTEAAPDPYGDIRLSNLDDEQLGGTNGAGTAAQTPLHPTSISSPHGTTAVLGAIAKYGASIGSLFAAGQASNVPTVGSPAYAANPYQVNTPATSMRVTVLVLVLISIFVIAISWGE